MARDAYADWRIFYNRLQIMRNQLKLKMVKDRKVFVVSDLTYIRRE